MQALRVRTRFNSIRRQCVEPVGKPHYPCDCSGDATSTLGRPLRLCILVLYHQPNPCCRARPASRTMSELAKGCTHYLDYRQNHGLQSFKIIYKYLVKPGQEARKLKVRGTRLFHPHIDGSGRKAALRAIRYYACWFCVPVD